MLGPGPDSAPVLRPRRRARRAGGPAQPTGLPAARALTSAVDRGLPAMMPQSPLLTSSTRTQVMSSVNRRREREGDGAAAAGAWRAVPAADPRADGQAGHDRGVERLSIGRLAEATGMPKSSVYVLFGSKEELQLAHRRRRPGELRGGGRLPGPALRPAGARTARRPLRGVPRLCRAAGVPGWLLLRGHRGRARGPPGHPGELPAGTDPAQLAFELSAILAGRAVTARLGA
jgi:hypothetical protein